MDERSGYVAGASDRVVGVQPAVLSDPSRAPHARIGRGLPALTTRGRRLAVVLLVAALVAVGFCAWYVSVEDPLYHWDWGAYHRMWMRTGQLLAAGDPYLLRHVPISIRHDDYNVTSILPLLPLYLAFGPSRTAYIAGVAVIYLLPAVVITCLVALTALREEGRRPSDTLILLYGAFVFAFPPFWAPTLRGLPDIVGLIPLGVATLLVLRSDIMAIRPVRTGIAVGLALWLAFLFRRWYAYALLSFVIVAALFALLQILRAPMEQRLRRFRDAALAFGALGATAVALALAFQTGLVTRILATSYRDAYAGYQEPLLRQFVVVYERLGAGELTVILVGLGIALWARNRAALFCACCAALTFISFATTQSPSVQHTLPMFFWLMAVAVYGLHRCLEVLAAPWRPVIAAALLALPLAASVASFVPDGRTALASLDAVLPAQSYLPHRIENFAEYRRMLDDLRALTRDGDKVGVFASSGVLSDDLLFAIEPGFEARLARPAHVDARDGFELRPLTARFAVVTDPITLHLPPETQQVISVPSAQILAGDGIGRAYERVAGPYRLASGVQAFVYQRTLPLDSAEIERVTSEFRKYYPGWAWDGEGRIFTPPRR
jgi:hypothetical protein